ncbi:hypothetical protein SISSUDRAFT_1047503, partial [Sistotremastrum suecicum HHB10207 ss-3]
MKVLNRFSRLRALLLKLHSYTPSLTFVSGITKVCEATCLCSAMLHVTGLAEGEEERFELRRDPQGWQVMNSERIDAIDWEEHWRSIAMKEAQIGI